MNLLALIWQVIAMKQEEHIMNEKKVMNMCVHPLIVNLHGCFQDDSSLYMVMEYIKGGELYSVMNKEGTLSNDHARFYAAEIMEALVFLHSKVRRKLLKRTDLDQTLSLRPGPSPRICTDAALDLLLTCAGNCLPGFEA